MIHDKDPRKPDKHYSAKEVGAKPIVLELNRHGGKKNIPFISPSNNISYSGNFYLKRRIYPYVCDCGEADPADLKQRSKETGQKNKES